MVWLSAVWCNIPVLSVFTSAFLIVWFISNSLWNFVWMLFNWLVWSSHEFLLMVIGNCFTQVTTSSGVLKSLRVMSLGNFVALPVYSIFVHSFPRNSISFLCTSWNPHNVGCMYKIQRVYVFRVAKYRVVKHDCDQRSGVDGEVLRFPVDFHFDTVIVVFVR